MSEKSWTRLLASLAVAMFASTAIAEDDEPKPLVVTLPDVISFPEAYRRVPFEIALLYHGPREIYNPFYTLFEPSGFLNFAAWAADAPIWSREGYTSDHLLFYVDRKNDGAQLAIVGLRPCTWFTARCIVRSTAQSRAWIEVLAVTSVGNVLDVGDLRHLVRANVLAGSGEWDRSLLEFGMARLFGAPDRFVARCRIDEGRIALAAGQPDRALTALQTAWKWNVGDKEVARLIDRATEQVAALRSGQVASVPAERPAPIAPPVIAPITDTKTPLPKAPPQTPEVPLPVPVPTPDVPVAPVEDPANDPSLEPVLGNPTPPVNHPVDEIVPPVLTEEGVVPESTGTPPTEDEVKPAPVDDGAPVPPPAGEPKPEDPKPEDPKPHDGPPGSDGSGAPSEKPDSSDGG